MLMSEFGPNQDSKLVPKSIPGSSRPKNDVNSSKLLGVMKSLSPLEELKILSVSPGGADAGAGGGPVVTGPEPGGGADGGGLDEAVAGLDVLVAEGEGALALGC